MYRQSLAVDQSSRLIKIKYTCIRIFDVIGWCQSLYIYMKSFKKKIKQCLTLVAFTKNNEQQSSANRDEL